ncbi:MAG TPA: hypothetical protein VK937_11295 [Candidatus Limnocylindria bacterium]|jgi:hypothetical protein|nr:hypothetical protein [Candidatus Limnocylindria bacterium]
MSGEFLLTLKETPSFEGELSLRLIKDSDSEGRASYSLVCEKKPPFDREEVPLIVAVRSGVFGDHLGLKEITTSIGWRKDIPPEEVEEILDTLKSQIPSAVPEAISGLDGTTYELLIERGSNMVQFTWWCGPPRVWKALGELSTRLLNRANASSMTKSLQSDTRKQLIKQLQGKLAEHRATLEEKSKELLRTHNDRCHELARSLRATGLTCPACGQHSKEIRFIDKSPDAKSYFICRLCGRSFRPEDLQLKGLM